MFRITIGEYTLTVADDYPSIYNEYHKQAKLIEILESSDAEGTICFVSVAKGLNQPFLVVVQKYSPGQENGFQPGILLIPETRLLFIGAGERLLAYTWDPPKRLWEKSVIVGFWGWERYHQFVIMSAELELAVWDIYGKKRWSTFVEPPWDYKIDGETIHLEVMGKQSIFSLQHGPGHIVQ